MPFDGHKGENFRIYSEHSTDYCTGGENSYRNISMITVANRREPTYLGNVFSNVYSFGVHPLAVRDGGHAF